MFLFLNPLGESGVVIPIKNGNGGLGQNRPGIQFLGDDVHRAAGDLYPGLQGLPDGIHATEAGQQ